MKRVILLSLVLMTLLNSCRYRDEECYTLTDKGKLLFDYAYYPSMEILDNVFVTVFNFNAWYVADAAQKEEIETLFFKNMTILEDSVGFYRLYENSQCKFMIATHGKDLQSVGNQWDVKSFSSIGDYYGCSVPHCLNEPDKMFHVRTLGDGQWQLLMDSTAKAPCSADWTIKVTGGVTMDLFTRDFSLNGKARFVYAAETSQFGKETIVDYDIVSSSLHRAGNLGSFDEGEWNMKAMRDGERDLNATAVFRPNQNVDITYRDKTESWSVIQSNLKY